MRVDPGELTEEVSFSLSTSLDLATWQSVGTVSIKAEHLDGAGVMTLAASSLPATVLAKRLQLVPVAGSAVQGRVKLDFVGMFYNADWIPEGHHFLNTELGHKRVAVAYYTEDSTATVAGSSEEETVAKCLAHCSGQADILRLVGIRLDAGGAYKCVCLQRDFDKFIGFHPDPDSVAFGSVHNSNVGYIYHLYKGFAITHSS